MVYTFHGFEKTQLKKKDSIVKLLFVGSIDRRKGIIDLLDVLIELKDELSFELYICGKITEDSIRDDYRMRIKKLQGRVIEFGYVSGYKKQKIFEESDILVLPSYGEGMPIVIMEAIATGNAIISTDVGAIPEIVSDDNGILHRPGDLDELKRALCKLVEDVDYLEKIKTNNFYQREKYSLIHNITEICNIYDKLTD